MRTGQRTTRIRRSTSRNADRERAPRASTCGGGQESSAPRRRPDRSHARTRRRSPRISKRDQSSVTRHATALAALIAERDERLKEQAMRHDALCGLWKERAPSCRNAFARRWQLVVMNRAGSREAHGHCRGVRSHPAPAGRVQTEVVGSSETLGQREDAREESQVVGAGATGRVAVQRGQCARLSVLCSSDGDSNGVRYIPSDSSRINLIPGDIWRRARPDLDRSAQGLRVARRRGEGDPSFDSTWPQ